MIDTLWGPFPRNEQRQGEQNRGNQHAARQVTHSAPLPTARASSTAESAAARRVLADGLLQRLGAKVGPERVREGVLRVGGVPEQKVRDALLA